MEKKWWKEAVGYQIYIKSFYDSNGDGIGDLQGIIKKLPYLADLGITLIWISPFYDSPMDDNGYDVRNFYKIHEQYGTMMDIHQLINEAHDLGIKVIIDLILNHTSDEHSWFIESKKSINNRYRDYYIWEKPRWKNGEEIEPTNWASFFGGSCWEKDELTNEYYMKIFSRKMPDLNWKNEQLRQEMIDMILWWMKIGIDGFRIDAVSHLSKSDFIDSKINLNPKYAEDWLKISNQPKVHDYLQELYKAAFSKKDIVTIGEVGGLATVKQGLEYSGYDRNELSMVFNFDHNWCNNAWSIDDPNNLKTDLVRLKANFTKWEVGLRENAWSPLYWLNHDHPRVVSQYGNLKFHDQSAKMLGTCLHFMWGTPFIYNGEEIGMTNYDFKEITDFMDVSVYTQYCIQKEKPDFDEKRFIRKQAISSRDNARTPFHWSKEINAGFTSGIPYIPLNYNYLTINVASEEKRDDSILNFYKKLIYLRTKSEYKLIIVYGKYRLLDAEDENIYAYIRENEKTKLLVICNFTAKTIDYDISKYKIIAKVIENYQNTIYNNKQVSLKEYGCIVFEVRELV